ncbi:hypothetical protein C1J01_05620 [Nonomuraea aridisoli]|uniref:Endonuclease/exonuclease/phosphatase domain-containing protein n=2 Tax=Nonomuraea aridisoli TaxID=2070368 RepID=A0A2W2G4C4_9ACTN|nr:hypothetical protein C1J01_05620 [Nonomuraea aridisoli]
MGKWMLAAGSLAVLLGVMTPAAYAGDGKRDEPVELTVMTFNIWTGGGRVDFGKVPAAIEAAHADVVGMQETDANLGRVAEALGWDHVYEPMSIISRYPIIVPRQGGDFVYVEVSPGRVVAVSNVHLQAYPYGPYDLRDGASLSSVLANENTIHMNAMAGRFTSLPALAEAGVPVFLTGDFNVPSHLDWTAKVAAATPRPYDEAVAWPVSKRLGDLGFRDSYREARPDPIADPGYTWTPGYPPPSMPADEVHDRIDFVYAAGPAKTLRSDVVGEKPSPAPLPGDFNGPHTDIVVEPWPSDHRAVASTFEVTPAPRPATLTAADATVARGERLELEGYGARHAADWVGLFPAGYEPTRRDIACISSDRPAWCRLADWAYLASGTRERPKEFSPGGKVGFDTSGLEPGEWVAWLMTTGRDATIVSAPFTVLDPAAQPWVRTDKSSYAPGEPITVTFGNAPGGALDWLGVYPAAEVPDGSPGSLRWAYVSGLASGTSTLGAGSQGTTWPLPPGAYAVHLLLDDGYTVAATARFTVAAP